jgi:hypothetical protein
MAIWSALPFIAQGAGGLAQTLFSGEGKALGELENLTNKSPMYSGGSSIRDYYNKSLQRYNINPFTGQLYQSSLQNAERGTNQALNALTERRAGLSNLGKIIGLQNDAKIKAGVVATNEQAQNLRMLGSAASANAAEDKYQYQQNELNPYLRKLQLAQQKAGGAAATKQAGLQNIFGALNSAGILMNGGKTESDNTTTSKITKMDVPILKKIAGINAPSALTLLKRRNLVNDDETYADFEDIPDYNTIDRGTK